MKEKTMFIVGPIGSLTEYIQKTKRLEETLYYNTNRGALKACIPHALWHILIIRHQFEAHAWKLGDFDYRNESNPKALHELPTHASFFRLSSFKRRIHNFTKNHICTISPSKQPDVIHFIKQRKLSIARFIVFF